MPGLAKAAANSGLSGIEHTVGIPCSLGGLTYMNGGSLRKNLSENIVYINTITHSGKQKCFFPADCNFSYRTSVFQKLDDTIITI